MSDLRGRAGVLFEPVHFSLRPRPRGQGKCIHLVGLEVSRLQIKALGGYTVERKEESLKQ